MMKWLMTRRSLIRVWMPGGSLLAISGCGLTDQQLTQIMQTVITTGLNLFVSQFVTTLAGGTTP